MMTAVWVSVTTLSAATTNAAASIGPSVVGQVPVYTDTTGQLMTPSSSLTNFTFVTPVITVPGGYYHGAMLTPWVDTNNAISIKWNKAPQVWEFLSVNIGDWTAITANSGSVAQTPTLPDDADNGVWSLTTGALTNAVAGYRVNTVSTVFQTNVICVIFRIRTPTSLSTDADGYELYAGVGDSTGDAAPVDGAYFYYLHSVSNGVWTARTANNSATTFATGAPTAPPTVAAATWYNLLLEGNATAVDFWVSSNDGQSYQWIGRSPSNIPVAPASRQTGLEFYIRKVGGSVGTTSRVSYLGRCEYWASRAN